MCLNFGECNQGDVLESNEESNNRNLLVRLRSPDSLSLIVITNYHSQNHTTCASASSLRLVFIVGAPFPFLAGVDGSSTACASSSQTVSASLYSQAAVSDMSLGSLDTATGLQKARHQFRTHPLSARFSSDPAVYTPLTRSLVVCAAEMIIP